VDCSDEEWIPIVAARGWAILTKDERITRRTHQLEVVRDHNALLFALRRKHLSGVEQGAAFVGALQRIANIAAKYTRPLIATVTSTGAVTVREGQRRGGVKRD